MENTNVDLQDSHLNQLKNLKNLFSKLVTVADNIKALNKATRFDDKAVDDLLNEYASNGWNGIIDVNGAVGLIDTKDRSGSSSNNFGTAVKAVCDANEFNEFHGWKGTIASINANGGGGPIYCNRDNYSSEHGDSSDKNRSQFNGGSFRDLDSGFIDNFSTAVNAVRDANEFNQFNGWKGTIASINANVAGGPITRSDANYPSNSLPNNQFQFNVGSFRELDSGSNNFGPAVNAVRDANEFNQFHGWKDTIASINANIAGGPITTSDANYPPNNQFQFNFGPAVNAVRDANEFNQFHGWKDTIASINANIAGGPITTSDANYPPNNQFQFNFDPAVNAVRDANEFNHFHGWKGTIASINANGAGGPIDTIDANYSSNSLPNNRFQYNVGSFRELDSCSNNFGPAINAVCDGNEFNGLYGLIGSNDAKDGNSLASNVPKFNVGSFGDVSSSSIDNSTSIGRNADFMLDRNGNSNIIKIKPHQGCDNNNMYVPTSDNKAKKLCCMYCLKRVQKLARHLQDVHKNEAEVKKFRRLPVRSKARRNIIDNIRKKGQFEWNTNAKINGGELLTSRRPNKKFKKTALDYLTCANCMGLCAKTILTRHWKKCTQTLMQDGRIVTVLGRAVEGRLHAEASDELRTDVFAKIREDVRIRMIRFDWLVIVYGNELCLNYSPHYQHAYIRKKLRDAAKVLFASKCISPEIEDFQSLYHVKYCNTVVEAIRVLAKFDRQTKLFGSPGTASTLVTLINTIGDLLVVESMRLEDTEVEYNAVRFLQVFRRDVKTKINKLVATTQAKARRGRKKNIPTTEDVNMLSSYLDTQTETCFVELSQKFSFQKWMQLSELTLATILVFNRRRTGEMRNIIVDDYHKRQIIADQCDTQLDALSEETKQLINSRMLIRGKLAREVPVLLKHTFENYIEILIRHRNDAGIPENNEFLFGMPSKIGQIRTVDACAVIRSFAVACGAKDPSSLRGTTLRKHIASYCSGIKFTDNDVTNIANFMGHSEKIHRDIYRHNALYREVEQMTNILVAGTKSSQKNNRSTANTKATNAEAMKAFISSDSSSGTSSDSYDDDEPENPQKKTKKRKTIRQRRGQQKVSKLDNNRKNKTDLVSTKKRIVGKTTTTPKTATIPQRRGQQKVSKLDNDRKNKSDVVSTKKNVVGKTTTTRKNKVALNTKNNLASKMSKSRK